MGNLIGLGIIIHNDLILNKEMLNKLNYQTGYYLTKSLEILNIIPIIQINLIILILKSHINKNK